MRFTCIPLAAMLFACTTQPGALSPALPGQSGPEGASSVTLSVSPGTIAPGGTANLTLTNGSGEQIGFNLCTSAIESSAGRPVRSDRVCTMELRTLEPGRNSTYAYELPDGIASGAYRFSTGVEWIGSRRRATVRSNNFQVGG